MLREWDSASRARDVPIRCDNRVCEDLLLALRLETGTRDAGFILFLLEFATHGGGCGRVLYFRKRAGLCVRGREGTAGHHGVAVITFEISGTHGRLRMGPWLSRMLGRVRGACALDVSTTCPLSDWPFG